jgi:integrase
VRPPKITRHEAQALSIEEAQKLLAQSAHDRMGTLYAFALATGMRRGELCALTWADVDTSARTATIRASISVVGKRSFEKSTESGRVRTMLSRRSRSTLSPRNAYVRHAKPSPSDRPTIGQGTCLPTR